MALDIAHKGLHRQRACAQTSPHQESAFVLSPEVFEFGYLAWTFLKKHREYGIERVEAQHLKPADEVILVCQHRGHHVVALQGLAVLHSPEGLLNDARPLLVLDGGAGGVAPHQLGA